MAASLPGRGAVAITVLPPNVHSKWTASQTVGAAGSVHSTRWAFPSRDKDVIAGGHRPFARLVLEVQSRAALSTITHSFQG